MEVKQREREEQGKGNGRGSRVFIKGGRAV